MFEETFPGFIKTCLQRADALIRLQLVAPQWWVPFCQLFYANLRRRGYGDSFLRAVFAKFTWGDRLLLLFPCEKPAREFDLRCVWSCANAVGIRELFASCDLNLAIIDSSPNSFPPNSAKLSRALNACQRICDEQGPMTDLRQLLWEHPN